MILVSFAYSLGRQLHKQIQLSNINYSYCEINNNVNNYCNNNSNVKKKVGYVNSHQKVSSHVQNKKT